ncbi:MAG: pyruvate formate lyase family protein, partial [Clostridia bacterium]|nr:pyruvate formate lyase family protein [Clostridia bacterium]
MDPTERIALLREEALEPVICRDEFYFLFLEYYFSHDSLPPEARYAASLLHAFSGLTPSISKGELIVGKCDLPLPEEKKELLDGLLSRLRDLLGDALQGQNSHMAVDYDLLLREGTSGIRRRIAALKEKNPASAAFYAAAETSLRAVEVYAARYAEAARALANKASDPREKEELSKIASVMERVPALPAESFYEAVESVHFLTHCLSLDPFRPCPQQFQLGRPDRYLLPYYEKDLASGAITPEEAQLLIDCLAIQINRRVPSGLSSGYMVCGRDRDGKPVANDLSLMFMQAVDDVRLVYPSVGFCWTPDTPAPFLEKACSILLKGRSHPAIFNDDLIARGLVSYGVPPEESHHYIHSTCVEITPAASSNVWVASPYTNLPGLLLGLMDREYSSFEELLAAYFEALDESIRREFETQSRFRAARAEKSMNPLLSAFVNDCLARGEDIERGGARYNWIMPSFVGAANLTDALYAVDELVFRTGELSMREFKKILDDDDKGAEPLRRRILEKLPKYGN